MRADRLKIVLSDAETQRIKLCGQQQFGIGMSSLPPVGGNAYVSVDTTLGWEERSTYVPKSGEFIIYSDRETTGSVVYPGIKIGDGTTDVANLPFFDDNILSIIIDHIADPIVHITENERTNWNNKIDEPLSEGTSGQVLTTDGNGGRTWTTASGGAVIDDTAGSGVMDKTWSANKITGEFEIQVGNINVLLATI